MNSSRIVLSVLLAFSCSSICWADSLVISFADGKTQTIPLDGPIKSITSMQYLASGEQARAAEGKGAPEADEPKRAPQPATPLKPMVRFKWAEPVAGQ